MAGFVHHSQYSFAEVSVAFLPTSPNLHLCRANDNASAIRGRAYVRANETVNLSILLRTILRATCMQDIYVFVVKQIFCSAGWLSSTAVIMPFW
jgi:hypothetical protein